MLGFLLSPPPRKRHEQGWASGAVPCCAPRTLTPAQASLHLPEAMSTAVATAPSAQRRALARRPDQRTGPQVTGGLTQVCASAPRSMKEEGGSSCRPVLAVGGSFRPGALGRGLLGSSAVWAFARKGVVSARPIGWTSPRPCSHSASGLSRGKTGAGQAWYPPEEQDRRGATGL